MNSKPDIILLPQANWYDYPSIALQLASFEAIHDLCLATGGFYCNSQHLDSHQLEQNIPLWDWLTPRPTVLELGDTLTRRR